MPYHSRAYLQQPLKRPRVATRKAGSLWLSYYLQRYPMPYTPDEKESKIGKLLKLGSPLIESEIV